MTQLDGMYPDSLNSPVIQDEAVCEPSRRSILKGMFAAGAGLILEACHGNSPDSAEVTTSEVPIIAHSVAPTEKASVPTTPETISEVFMKRVAQTMINAADKNHPAGWRFASEIQDGHYQTDRDVGASSIGMGFLAMADKYPHETQWLSAAKNTSLWLRAVADTDANGNMFWHDYNDDDDISSSTYTSFDDGTIGIGDFFWSLYEHTKDPKDKRVALSSVRWTFSQAEKHGNAYSWKWDTSPGADKDYEMGLGEGVAGIVCTLASYYERTQTSDPAFAADCKKYIDGALNYIDSVRQTLGNGDGDARALPETGLVGQDGDTVMNAGYLSGAAGAAFMYLKLYEVFDDKEYLAQANTLFSWLEDADNGPLVNQPNGSVAWKLMLDPDGGDNPILATGFEEGNAGIGWTYLQAYNATGKKQKRYLDYAQKAADWLLEVGISDKGGLTWAEDMQPTSKIRHANLNNGAAGIGMFLQDVYLATNEAKYQTGAKAALHWLMATAFHDGPNTYWNDNDGDNPYGRDMSWHWGNAGIVSFMLHMQGGTNDVPGEQPALSR